MSAEFGGSDLEASGIMSHWPQDNVARSPLGDGDQKWKIMLLCDVQLWFCCCYKIPLGQIPIISPPHMAHLSLQILLGFTMFTTTSPSSQPPQLFLEIFCFPLHLPPSSRSLAAMAFTHIFEHQPRKAIWLQIMQVRIIVILESILTLDDHFAGPVQSPASICFI